MTDLADLLARIDQAAGNGQLILRLTPAAAKRWETWYHAMSRTVHTRRLDTYGWRFMLHLALQQGALEEVDDDTLRRVCLLLEHQLELRRQLDPVDAEGAVATFEELVRRQLRIRGLLTRRELRRYTNADRHGLWIFSTALENLQKAGDIRYDAKAQRFHLAPEVKA
jgi:hypothetical protein